jgi:hypothetical protein
MVIVESTGVGPRDMEGQLYIITHSSIIHSSQKCNLVSPLGYPWGGGDKLEEQHDLWET